MSTHSYNPRKGGSGGNWDLFHTPLSIYRGGECFQDVLYQFPHTSNWLNLVRWPMLAAKEAEKVKSGLPKFGCRQRAKGLGMTVRQVTCSICCCACLRWGWNEFMYIKHSAWYLAWNQCSRNILMTWRKKSLCSYLSICLSIHSSIPISLLFLAADCLQGPPSISFVGWITL